jgi:tetratricopeptide (TPR) repeat protein
MKISYFRMFRVVGFCLAVFVGIVSVGVNPFGLILPAEWFIVLGGTWFALFVTYGLDSVRFTKDSLLALLSERDPNDKYVKIARAGSRYALGATVFCFILDVLTAIGKSDGPIREVAERLASASVAILIGLVLSEIVFPFLEANYQKKEETLSSGGKVPLLFGMCMAGVLPLLIILWFVSDKSHGASGKGAEDTWRAAERLMDDCKYDEASVMLRRLIHKYPNCYHGYGDLGYLALVRGDLDEAERNYTKAYNLLPEEFYEKKLAAIRKAKENRMKDAAKKPPEPTAHPR